VKDSENGNPKKIGRGALENTIDPKGDFRAAAQLSAAVSSTVTVAKH
jgi:hypothetical protein